MKLVSQVQKYGSYVKQIQNVVTSLKECELMHGKTTLLERKVVCTIEGMTALTYKVLYKVLFISKYDVLGCL